MVDLVHRTFRGHGWTFLCYPMGMTIGADQKASILNALKLGASIQELADRYEVSTKTIQRVKAKRLSRVIQVQADPTDLDLAPVLIDPPALEGDLTLLEPQTLLTDAVAGFRRIRRAMLSIAEDELKSDRDRASAARVGVEAGAKIVVVAAMIGGSGAHAVEGETPELDAIKDIVEGKA